VWANLRISSAAGLLTETAPVLLNANLMQPLGIVRLPPSTDILSDPASVTTALRGWASGGMSRTLKPDCMIWAPMDSYAELGRSDNKYAGSSQMIVEEWGANRQSRIEDLDGSDQYHFFDISAGELTVTPGKTQKLYFAFKSWSLAYVDAHLHVRLYYRPRRLTI
jgi:hypothetical protein